MELHSISINPVPAGADAGLFEGYDGSKLRFARWEPTRGPVRGTVCIFSGRGETIEKYFEVVADLRRRGYAVAIHDWRGQGGSERPLSNRRKGHVVGFTEYDRDLAIFMNEIVVPHMPPPFTALGHSLGGNILLRNAQDELSPFDRMVLSAPMIEIHRDALGATQRQARIYAETSALMGLSSTYVRGGDGEPEEFVAFEDSDLTSDFVRWSRNKAILDAAPELALGSPTVGWLKSALRSCAMLQRPDYPKYVSVPVLMFAAGADKIVSTRRIEDFGVELKVGGVILMPGSKHEILQENDAIRQRFWAAFDAYMGVAIPKAA